MTIQQIYALQLARVHTLETQLKESVSSIAAKVFSLILSDQGNAFLFVPVLNFHKIQLKIVPLVA